MFLSPQYAATSPIGVNVVEAGSEDYNVLTVGGLDAFDSAPVRDLKSIKGGVFNDNDDIFSGWRSGQPGLPLS